MLKKTIGVIVTILATVQGQAAPGDVYQLAEYQIPVMRMGYEVGSIPKPTGRLVNPRKKVHTLNRATLLSDSNLFMRISGSFFAYHNITLGTSLAPVALPALKTGSMGPYQSMRLESKERSPALDYFTGELKITENLKNGYPDGKAVVVPVPASEHIKAGNAGLFIEGKPFEPSLCVTTAQKAAK